MSPPVKGDWREALARRMHSGAYAKRATPPERKHFVAHGDLSAGQGSYYAVVLAGSGDVEEVREALRRYWDVARVSVLNDSQFTDLVSEQEEERR